jgi:hypothetical protein
MRYTHRLLGLVLSFAFPLGAGCSGGGIDNMTGAGGAGNPSTGDLPPTTGSVVAVSTGFFTPPGVWMNAYGDIEDQHATALAVNGAGDVAVIGAARGTINFGNIPWEGSATDTDVVVAKLSLEGQSLWSRRYGDSCDQHGSAVAHVASGNVLIAGDFCGKMDFGTTTVETKGAEVDAFVAVIDPFGEDVYSRSFGGKGAQIARAAAVDADGNAIIAGSFDQAFDDGTGAVASAGLDDAFVIKLDPKGKLLWSLSFGGTESDIPRSVAVDAMGNVIVGGSFGGTVDFGAGPHTAGVGHSSGFVLQLDPDGKTLWSKSFGVDNDVVVSGVAVGPNGNVATTGTFLGTTDFGGGPATSAGAEDAFVEVMSSAGDHVWGSTFGAQKSQHGTGVAVGANGDVMISGVSDETIDLSGVNPNGPVTLISPFNQLGENMVYAIKFDVAGTPILAWAIDSADPMECVGVGLDQQLGMVLAGSFQGEIDFQFAPVKGAGGWDMFVTRQQ